MSALAVVAHALGASVTGSDRAAGSPYGAPLRAAGIEPGDRPRRRQRPGRRRGRLLDGDPTGQSGAHDRAPELHRADLLGEITRLKPTIAVSGTHGKTTTSSMLVHALRGAGADPGYLVGGEVRSTGANAGWGAGEWLVVEADESDRSLLKLAPTIAVVTNAELDHHTTYASRRDVDDTFRAFLALARDEVVPPDLVGLARRPVIFDAEAQLTADGSRFDFDGVPVVLHGPRRAQRAQRRRRADRDPVGRRGRGPGGVGARDLRGCGPPLRAPRHDRRRRPGRRRLRPSPDRGRGHDRGRSHARAAPRHRVLSAAPVLAHPARGAGLRRRARRAPTSRSCSTSIRRARPPRTSRASPACSSPRRRPTPAAASASRGCARTRTPSASCAPSCARATCC